MDPFCEAIKSCQNEFEKIIKNGKYDLNTEMLIAVWKKDNKQIHGAHYSHFFQEEAIPDQILQFLSIAQNRADLVHALFILLQETSLALLTRLYTDSCIGTIYYPLLVACGIIISGIVFSRLLTEDRIKRLAMLHNVKVAQQPAAF